MSNARVSLALFALLVSASVARAQLLATPAPERDEAQVLVERAAAELEAGRLDAAEGLFQQAADLEPGHAVPQVGLCEVRQKLGELQQALEACRKARALAPHEVLPALRLGQVLALSDLTAEALEAFAAARELVPSQPGAYLLPALLLRDLGRPDEAIDLLEQARSAGVEQADVSEELSFLLLARGDARQARDVAASARARFPESVGLKLALGLALAREREERDEAVSLLSEVLAEGIGDPGRVHLEVGILLLGMGRNEEALVHLREAVTLLPEQPAAHYRLAEALRATGDAAGANRELERFEELSGERGTAARQVVELMAALQEVRDLALQKRLSEALERIDDVLKDHPDEAQAHTLRAKVLSAQGSYSGALVSIVRARELAPRAAECHFLEGLFLVRLGEPAEGEAALLRAVDLNPGLAQAHELLGTVAANDDRHEQAVERFRKAQAQGLDTPALRARLAESLRRLGRLEEAEQALAGAGRR